MSHAMAETLFQYYIILEDKRQQETCHNIAIIRFGQFMYPQCVMQSFSCDASSDIEESLPQSHDIFDSSMTVNDSDIFSHDLSLD